MTTKPQKCKDLNLNISQFNTCIYEAETVKLPELSSFSSYIFKSKSREHSCHGCVTVSLLKEKTQMQSSLI